MISVNLYDNAFLHLPSCSVHGKTAKHISYTRWHLEWGGGITIFTDAFLADGRVIPTVHSQVKVGWLLEPREYMPGNYAGAERNLPMLDYLLTHDQELLDKYPDKARFVPFGGCWIQQENFGLAQKTGDVSMIYSGKKHLPGHRLRHEAAMRFATRLQCYGRGAPKASQLAIKEPGLMPFRFSVVIENSVAENFFTEKLLDCFAVGTIPIYRGCPNIGKFFDPHGIIQFNTLDELDAILKRLEEEGPRQYAESRLCAERNLELMRPYEITDDWIALNVLEKLL